MRKYTTGAIRDTNKGKNDYSRYFSPLVMKERGDYMRRHAVRSDGSIRPGDNWKNRFGETPKEHYDNCFESHCRHHLEFWLGHDGYLSRRQKIDAICAMMFNLDAYLHVELEEELREKN